MSILALLKARLAERGQGGANDVIRDVQHQMTPPVQTQSVQDPQTTYDLLDAQYNRLASDYDRSVRNLGYSHQAHTRQGSLWDQLEQQRANNGGYGGDRFYQAGEIYNYDPTVSGYRGSISGQLINQPQAYQAPTLASNPGPYDKYMADDPYYQQLQAEQAAANAPPPAPVVNTKKIDPISGDKTHVLFGGTYGGGGGER